MSDKKVFNFAGRDTDVQWDGRLCIHIAECGQAEGELFVGGRDPWCMPDTSTPDAVAEVCQRCPSGALTYRQKSGQPNERAQAENTVRVVYNGPLYARGELAIQGAPDDMPGVRYRAALCRCGQSKNKPFCDNSHVAANFEDYGAVGQTGSATTASGGPLEIKPLTDGPLLLSGTVTLFAASGRAAWRGEKVALCRCGASNNKPFCDGSHNAIAFRAE